MSHYDYLSPHGLSGPVENLMAIAVMAGGLQDRDPAWDYFRFGQSGLSATEKELRIAAWRNLTPAYKRAMDELKGYHFAHVLWMDLKDFKLQDRLQIEADLKRKFNAAWTQAGPTRAADPPAAAAAGAGAAGAGAAGAGAAGAPASRTFKTPGSGFRRFPGMQPPTQEGARAAPPADLLPPSGSGGGDDGSGDTEKKFPVVPVAIGAAVLAAILLMRKK